MIETVLATFGVYGGACVIGFVAGMFPIVSIELFLMGISTWTSPSPLGFVALVLLAAVGHQLAKTICYYTGTGLLELPTGKLKVRIDRMGARIDRWRRGPKVIMVLAATIGLPPLYLVVFIAKPLLHMRLASFTLIVFFGRIGRYGFLMFVPQLFK